MKNIITSLIGILMCTVMLGQTDAISYQAVIIDPNVQELPGVNATGNILPNTTIALRFTILDDSGAIEYQEIQNTETDAYGLINVFIGLGEAVQGQFDEILWDGFSKDLQVEIAFEGTDFEPLSQQKLTFIPFAYHRDIIASGDVTVEGTSTFLSDVIIDGTTTLNNGVELNGTTSLNGDLTVAGITNLENELSVEGTAAFNDDVSISGNNSIENNLSVVGASVLGGALRVENGSATQLSGALDVTGATTLNETLDVLDATSLGATLDVMEQANFNASVAVSEDITVGNNTTISNNLVVGNATTIENELTVGSDARIEGMTTINGATLLNNSLTVANESATELSGTLSVAKNTVIDGTTLLQNKLTVANESPTELTGALIVQGNTTMNEDFTINGTTNINKDLFVLGESSLDGILTVGGATQLDDNLAVSGTSNFEEDVTIQSNALIAETLSVDGVTSLHDELQVTNAASTNLSGILNVEGITSLNAELSVQGSSVFENDVVINGETALNSDLELTGNLQVSEEIETATLLVKSSNGSGHIATFENTSGSRNADGIAIKLNASTLSIDNHFLSFYGDGDYLAGRIESYDLLGGDLFESFPSPDFSTLIDVFDFSQVLEYEPPSLDFSQGSFPNPNFSRGSLPSLTIDFGALDFDWNRGSLPSLSFNGGSLPTADFDIGNLNLNFDGFFNPSAGIDAASQIAEMVGWAERNGSPGFIPTTPTKIVLTPLILGARQLSRNQGVVYGSKGADYAEWLEKENPEENFSIGEVVGVKGGKISRNTEDADHVMTISYNPIVLGNMPETGKEDAYEKVGFIGQVPALVAGKVVKGDYIVASGNNDGYAKAVSPDNIQLQDLKNIIGRAWSESNGNNLSLINVSVGLKTNEWIVIFEQQDAKLKAIEAKLEKLEIVSQKVAKLEQHLQQLGLE
ncbi:hypothetical protein [Altibacter sp. HG106]|uniref:hypothetical protein n=1 Tax=Altibacter sp. HG106 TaxID=3023937 RepID=UPI002350A06C|nr:hypothetical protein [Altibacter sp. HG106]MDC7995104.1 hypothetical protein [Altibacter sp. HG106]